MTTFSNLVEIVNRTRTAQERLFYIVYAFRERLKKMELRQCIVNDTYSSLLGGGKKNLSQALKVVYPDSPVMFKDAAEGRWCWYDGSADYTTAGRQYAYISTTHSICCLPR